MNYIELHNDPEILKLGIIMALYREPMPKQSDLPSTHYDSQKYQKKLHSWQEQSFIAYLKEPEFKVGEWIWYNNDKVQIHNIEGNKAFIEYKKMALMRDAKVKDLYHYYPGQEVESFKYVREVGIIDKESISNVNPTSRELKYHKKWQEVEEPEPMLISETKYHEPTYEPNPNYTQFQADKKSAKILAEI